MWSIWETLRDVFRLFSAARSLSVPEHRGRPARAGIGSGACQLDRALPYRSRSCLSASHPKSVRTMRVICLGIVLGWAALAPTSASAQPAIIAQKVSCEPDTEKRLAIDGTISACRLAAPAKLLVGPGGNNGEVSCAAGGSVEFHRTGYLSYCSAAAAARSYRDRAGRETRCRANARLAFSEDGYLEYCS